MADTDTTPGAFDLGDFFLALTDGAAAEPVAVDDDFWSEGVAKLPAGRLVSTFRTDGNWTNWERHPQGDEVIVQLSGAQELILETDPPRRVRLTKGQFAVVPSGVWHTADVVEPGEALFITRGEGTEHKPR